MRDNYALWVAWWTSLFFWISMLFAQSHTQACYDPYHADNKWTCWGIYSLFHLAHEDYFSRMLRTVPMFIGLWWQAFVAAILYRYVSPSMPSPTNIPLYTINLLQNRRDLLGLLPSSAMAVRSLYPLNLQGDSRKAGNTEEN